MQVAPALLSDARSAAAYAIFFASYFVFALGKFPGLKIDRPGAAIIGAVLMVAFRIVTAQEALRAIDFPTIVLLFSMTLIVAHLHLGGFFEWIADLTVLRLSAQQLLAAVVFVSGILSAFLVNDVVCLVMTPFIVKVTRRLALEPLPYLLALATASNIGSVATITGNPQNMLIGSVSQIGYVDFFVHLGPVALAGLLIDWALLHWIYLRRVRAAAPAPARTLSTPARHRPRMKPVVVLLLVLAGFLAGVPPALMEKIFEPFQSQFEGGTGLGLAIVYQIVQAHGAKISVHAAPGGGAEFVLEVLKVRAAEASEDAPSIAEAEVSHG